MIAKRERVSVQRCALKVDQPQATAPARDLIAHCLANVPVPAQIPPWARLHIRHIDLGTIDLRRPHPDLQRALELRIAAAYQRAVAIDQRPAPDADAVWYGQRSQVLIDLLTTAMTGQHLPWYAPQVSDQRLPAGVIPTQAFTKVLPSLLQELLRSPPPGMAMHSLANQLTSHPMWTRWQQLSECQQLLSWIGILTPARQSAAHENITPDQYQIIDTINSDRPSHRASVTEVQTSPELTDSAKPNAENHPVGPSAATPPPVDIPDEPGAGAATPPATNPPPPSLPPPSTQPASTDHSAAPTKAVTPHAADQRQPRSDSAASPGSAQQRSNDSVTTEEPPAFSDHTPPPEVVSPWGWYSAWAGIGLVIQAIRRYQLDQLWSGSSRSDSADVVADATHAGWHWLKILSALTARCELAESDPWPEFVQLLRTELNSFGSELAQTLTLPSNWLPHLSPRALAGDIGHAVLDQLDWQLNHDHGLTLIDLTQRPGYVLAADRHLSVSFPLDHADIMLRAAGLDHDPGWLPELGWVVRYHFIPWPDPPPLRGDVLSPIDPDNPLDDAS